MATDPGDGDKDKTPSVEDLQKQIENLNKGIAGYRDEAKLAKDEAFNAKKEATDAKLKAEEALKKTDKDEPVELNTDDQKKLEAWAKAQGFVTKQEMEEQKNQLFGETLKNIEGQALEEFLGSYPQFKDEEEFKKVKDQFALYKQPTTLSGYRTVLGKVVKDLGIGKDDEAAKARAEMQARTRLALGGGSSKDDGGTDDETQIGEYMKKYPKLSREQIVDRLAEINELAASRKKK